jgi:hypothetical protein
MRFFLWFGLAWWSLACALVFCGALVAFPVKNRALAQDRVVAAESGACTYSHPVRLIPLLADLPQPVRDALGDMAEKDGAFQKTDALLPGPKLPFRRFIMAGQWSDLYFVRYEEGGLANARYIALYRLSTADNGIERLGVSGRFLNCQAIDDLLDGKLKLPQPPPPRPVP